MKRVIFREVCKKRLNKLLANTPDENLKEVASGFPLALYKFKKNETRFVSGNNSTIQLCILMNNCERFDQVIISLLRSTFFSRLTAVTHKETEQ